LFPYKNFLNALKASLRIRLLGQCADLAMTFGGRLKKKRLCDDPQVVRSRGRTFLKAKLEKSVYTKMSSLTQGFVGTYMIESGSCSKPDLTSLITSRSSE